MTKRISANRAFVNSTFALARLALIDHLATQPRTATVEQQVAQLTQANRGQGRAVLVNSGNGKQSQIDIIEVEE